VRTHQNDDTGPLLDVKARIDRLALFSIFLTGVFFLGALVRSFIYPPLTKLDLAWLLLLFSGFFALTWSLQGCARFVLLNALPRTARLTFRDERTGLYTPRYMLERLQNEIARSARHSTSFSVLYLRLNGLEQWARSISQSDREAFWRDLASGLRILSRREDVMSQWSENSLLIFLPNTEFLSGYMLAERLEEALSEGGVLRPRGRAPEFEPGIGCAAYPYNGRDALEVIRYAESASHPSLDLPQEFGPLWDRISSRNL